MDVPQVLHMSEEALKFVPMLRYVKEDKTRKLKR